MHRTLRTLALFTSVLALVLASCGDDDRGASVGDPEPGATSEPSSGGGDPAVGGEGTDGGSAGDDTAVATLGGTTYEFVVTYCQRIMGGVSGTGEARDGSGTTITFSLPPMDEGEALDTPFVTVDTGDLRWEADANNEQMYSDIGPGQSEVTSFTVDGPQGSGTGSFVETYAAMSGPTDAVEGSFEMSCS